jgi:hypothetical protein
MIPCINEGTVEGNGEVVELLERWLERAKLGQLSYIALAATEGPIHVYNDFAGLRGCEFAAYYGLAAVQKRIMTAQDEHLARPIVKSTTADRYCWQVNRAPCCFDFFAWLVMAKIYQAQEKVPGPLRVGFQWGEAGKDHALTTAGRWKFYDSVIIPGLALIGAVEDDTCVADGRVVERYTFTDIVRACRLSHDVPLLRPTPKAVEAMQVIGYDGPYITITLREAAYGAHRNSNMDEWRKLADYLTANGERVIFVRDTRFALEGIDGYQTCPAASVDIDARCAMYEGARANLFVSNGPWSLALFGTRPWLMFNEISGMDPYPPNTDAWWRRFHGIGFNEQFPWSQPHQRIVWKRDTFRNMCEAWEQIEPLLPVPACERASQAAE